MVKPTVRMSIGSEIRKGIRPQGAELTDEDVGRVLSMFEGFGRVMHGDVGKRVWDTPNGLVMENNEQRDTRKNRRKGMVE